jgi:predicted naringenin-chalcone synthase
MFFLETIPFGYSIKSLKTFNLSYKSDCVGNSIFSDGIAILFIKQWHL